VPDGPIEDKRKPIALGAAMFGALGLLVSVVLASIFNPRIRFSDDLGPEVSKNTLAVIPGAHWSQSDFQLVGFKARNEIDMRGATGGSPLVVGVGGTTSGGRSEQVALSLANAFAARDLNVLLVEVDPSRTLSSELDLSDQCGLADIMKSTISLSKAVSRKTTDHGEISVLSAGRTDDDSLVSPLSTITIRDYRALVDKAATDHDVIIFAVGALSAGKQSALGASVSDHFVLTTSAGDKKRVVTNAMTLLDRVTPDRYFLVMNRASALDPMLEREEGRWDIFGGFLNQFT
jgi:hypothetical protein